jgi:nucleoside-diphosphate-sugar epimerase
MEALVFGASGQMGRAVARSLLDAGWTVRAVTRGGRPLSPGLEGAIAVDGTGRTRAQIIGQGADALFDPFCMDAGGAADLLALRDRVGHFTVISSAAVYADQQGNSLETEDFPQFATPVTEDQPTVPAGTSYAGAKVAMERALRDSGAPVAILRPGAIHGPGARHPREWVVVKRLLDGRTRMAVVHADGQFGTTAAGAVGSLTVAILRGGATGTFNVADADAPTTAAIARTIAGQMNQALDVVPVPPDHGTVGHTPWSVPGPFISDCARARALGWQPEPYAAAVAPMVDWLAGLHGQDWRSAFPAFAQYGFDPFDYAAEDAVLARVS